MADLEDLDLEELSREQARFNGFEVLNGESETASRVEQAVDVNGGTILYNKDEEIYGVHTPALVYNGDDSEPDCLVGVDGSGEARLLCDFRYL